MVKDAFSVKIVPSLVPTLVVSSLNWEAFEEFVEAEAISKEVIEDVLSFTFAVRLFKAVVVAAFSEALV